MSDLARRLVACPRFRYMPRMADIYGRQIVRVGGARLTLAWEGNPHHRLAPDIIAASAADFLPDLDDPATVGCLLALVREAYGRPDIYTHPIWSIDTGQICCWVATIEGETGWRGPTEPPPSSRRWRQYEDRSRK